MFDSLEFNFFYHLHAVASYWYFALYMYLYKSNSKQHLRLAHNLFIWEINLEKDPMNRLGKGGARLLDFPC